MKFVKALNQGIVTDLGIGKGVYSITIEGCEVEDSIASKIKDVFGHLVEVSDMEGVEVAEEKLEVSGGQLPSEGATPVEAPVEEVAVDTVAPTEIVEEIPADLAPEEVIPSTEEVSADDSEVVA